MQLYHNFHKYSYYILYKKSQADEQPDSFINNNNFKYYKT